MKIATKNGDDLTTTLLFNKERKSKADIVFDALGSFDELSAFFGLIKAKIKSLNNEDSLKFSRFHFLLEKIQLDLIKLMGELNCENEEDVLKYIQKFEALTESDYCAIDEEVSFLQNLDELKQKSWVLYGKTEVGALFDICSKVARRAERQLAAAEESLRRTSSLNIRSVIKKYTNRLSDCFYLIARLSDYILTPCEKMTTASSV